MAWLHVPLSYWYMYVVQCKRAPAPEEGVTDSLITKIIPNMPIVQALSTIQLP